ncbi:MAG TPA: hypothetical protein VF718_03355 [Allosphingosinicella sp.]
MLPLLAVLGSSACGAAGDESIVRDAEARLVLPAGADPLARYDRHYAISGTTATGIFLRSETGEGKVAFVATERDLPFVADGGCGVVEVRLNLKSKVWERPFCHGP